MDPDSGREAGQIGVGLLFNAAVPRILSKRPESVDFLAVVPDTLQVDCRGSAAAPLRFVEIESLVDVVDAISAAVPIVGHGVGLSIGTPGDLDWPYVERMKYWAERWSFPWFSEHLSFFRLPRGTTAAHEAGMAMMLPLDRGVLRSVARRACQVQSALGIPFLLENGVGYTRPARDDFEEWEFLNELTRRSSAGLLLDLHNLYTNAVNHGDDPLAYLDRLDLSTVIEIHVAGGERLDGMYTDAHSGAVPEAVWQLLEYALPRLTRLRGITFEFHESCIPRLGEKGVIDQLERIRGVIAADPTGRER